MPVALTTDSVFDRAVAFLQEYAQGRSNALLALADTAWATPRDDADVDVEPLDLEGLATPFERSGINDQYEEALREEDGSVSDLSGLTLQGDFLSTLERVFRAGPLASTKVRRRAHAAARLQGHANARGLLSRIQEQVYEVLSAGQNGFVPPPPANRLQDVVATAKDENQSMGRPRSVTEGTIVHAP